MTEMEQLLLAAKAAGIRHIEYTNGYDGRGGLVLCDENGNHTTTWNPRDNDGDSFRLLVALRVNLHFYWDGENDQYDEVGVYTQGANCDTREYLVGVDDRAATRHAIFMAAVKLGEKIQ